MARCVSLLFVGVICCNILVRGQPPLSPTTGPPSALPPVQAAPDCAVLEPKCKEDIPFKIGESIWWVGKIYIGSSETLLTPGNMEGMPHADVLPVIDDMPGDPNAKPPVGEKPETPCGDNKCSITSYKPDSCQAIKVLVSRNEDGSIGLKEAVFNKATNSVSLIENLWLPADQSKAIFKQEFGYYGTMDKSGKPKFVDPAPEEIKKDQENDLVLMGASKSGDWALFSTCRKYVAFVLYTDAIVRAKGVKVFDEEITPLLQPLAINPEDLKDIPTDMPIKLDSFIPDGSHGKKIPKIPPPTEDPEEPVHSSTNPVKPTETPLPSMIPEEHSSTNPVKPTETPLLSMIPEEQSALNVMSPSNVP